MPGTLFVIATPIGNLGDISFRALEIIKSVDFILCEDTRVTQKLFTHYNIHIPMISYHQHSQLEKIDYIIELLHEGKNLALVSDAGTPGISDPGNKLVNSAIEKLRDVTIASIPGPSALTAAASISGFPMDRFAFMGFPPAKKKRKKFFEEIRGLKYPIILYESKHRILKTLNELKEVAGTQRKIVLCRELTKKFETIYRGTIAEILDRFPDEEARGEFVIIISSTTK